MEKGIIKNVSIEDFKTNENFVNYVDDDFMVINSLENVPYSNGTVRLHEREKKQQKQKKEQKENTI